MVDHNSHSVQQINTHSARGNDDAFVIRSSASFTNTSSPRSAVQSCRRQAQRDQHYDAPRLIIKYRPASFFSIPNENKKTKKGKLCEVKKKLTILCLC